MSKAVLRSRKKKAFGLVQSGRFEEARSLFKALSQQDPKDAETWYMLGAINGQLANFESAIACCRRAVELQPDYVEAWYNLAQACMHCDSVPEAIAAYRKVIGLQPDHVEAHFNLGYAMEQSGDYENAVKCYRAAIGIRPDYVEAYCNLGNLMNNLSQGTNDEGISHLRLALKINPGHIMGHLYLGRALHRCGKLEEAIGHFDRVLEKEPQHVEAIAGKALTLEKKGEFGKGLEILEPLLASRNVHVADAFAALAPHLGRTEEAIVLLEQALGQRVNRSDARSLHFKSGKLLDKSGDFDRAFHHFSEANSLRRSGYDIEADLSHLDSIRTFFSEARLAQLPRASHGSSLPVFVVGMPRSGTTLVEQILDSHSQVFGAGELVLVENSAHAIAARLASGKRYPDFLENVPANVLEDVARLHLDKLQAYQPEALRIVDKMPHNFRYLGLIELLFPGAHVIHCTRHPLDTCLSIYTYDFNALHGYATDLAWLGRYYRRYTELMDHWKRVLSVPVLDVSYEAMVADQAAMTRKIVEFCGLPWDEQCLAFYRNKRSVNTPSYDQVRQPIYSKSVARWRHYERHLEPLKQALGIEG